MTTDNINEIETVRDEYLSKLKKVTLVEAGVSINDVDIYLKYIDGEDAEGIKKQAQQVASDINQQDSYADPQQDPRVWRPFDKKKKGTIK